MPYLKFLVSENASRVQIRPPEVFASTISSVRPSSRRAADPGVQQGCRRQSAKLLRKELIADAVRVVSTLYLRLWPAYWLTGLRLVRYVAIGVRFNAELNMFPELQRRACCGPETGGYLGKY